MSFPFIIADDMDDIVILSAPFVAGTAVAAALSGHSDGVVSAVSAPDTLLLALSAPAVLAAFLFAARKNGRKAEYVLLFFLLGVFCGLAGAGRPLNDGPRFAAAARNRFCALIDSLDFANGGTAPLLKAVLCGDRSSLSRETAAAFRGAGAAHILALSGLHLGIIYLLAGRVLSIFGKSRAGAIARSSVLVLLCGFYAVVTGAAPSLVRAFIFICLGEFASHNPGRRRRNVNILCAALIIQLCFNPGVIRSLGFQLSYLAMAGIFFLFPKLQAWYPAAGPVAGKTRIASLAGGRTAQDNSGASAASRIVRNGIAASIGGRLLLRMGLMRRMWEAMALTVSCQVFTAPLVWLRFHTFPTYFLLTNLLALPLTWVVVVSAVLMLLCGVVFPSCPLLPLLIRVTDDTSQLLVRCLEIISTM